MERTNDLSREILYKMDTLGCLALQKMIFVKPDKLAWGDLGFSRPPQVGADFHKWLEIYTEVRSTSARSTQFLN